jgi:hypothetical protein
VETGATASGDITLDSLTLASVTNIGLHEEDIHGANQELAFYQATGGTLRLTNADGSAFGLYRVDSITTALGVIYGIDVTLLHAAGTVADEDVLSVWFEPPQACDPGVRVVHTLVGEDTTPASGERGDFRLVFEGDRRDVRRAYQLLRGRRLRRHWQRVPLRCRPQGGQLRQQQRVSGGRADRRVVHPGAAD